MENAEEVMQLLEDFSKSKPKDIPRELEEYLGYVAKTGDPVYQWSLVKCLFREKLMNVITDFYESTPTIELPPCRNVDPFNYERMKSCLLERLESFPNAPFTVQRICELLTNPRKEYNRADKYMRAIEKNILVVSTREPGSGKRQDGENNQTDTVLNGIPDSRGDVEDGINSPLLGTPPASNEVIVSTCSEQEEIEISDSSVLIPDNEKAWLKTSTDILPNPTLQDSPLVFKKNIENSNSKQIGLKTLLKTGETLPIPDISTSDNEVISTSEDSLKDSSANIALSSDSETPEITSNSGLDVDEISTDFVPQLTEEDICSEDEDIKELSNVSSIIENASIAAVEVENKEIKIESSDLINNEELNVDEIPTDFEPHIREDVSPENEDIKDAIVDSPNENSIITNNEEIDKNNVNDIESSDSNPKVDEFEVKLSVVDDNLQIIDSESIDSESSNELIHDIKVIPIQEEDKLDLKDEREHEVMPKSSLIQDETTVSETSNKEKYSVELCETVNLSIDTMPKDTEPSEIIDKEHLEVLNKESNGSKTDVDEIPHIATLPTNTLNDQVLITSDSTIMEKVSINESTDIIKKSEESCEQERIEGSIIHTTHNIISEVEPILEMEEAAVEQTSCRMEEEAMDVDESSNQQMVTSEGENEGEPMDQSDQLLS
uniref:Serine/threonine-protein phosphatase 4 regulatory subunit 2 n=1 Tax=Clastoptera arizonana TaxID=38151 RepID=A0A1B6CYH6_9HEMI